MKNIVTTLAICFICAFSFGQDSMSFKGISFNTSLSEFTKQLTNKGMTLQHTQTETISVISVFKGDFAGYSDCEVFVFSTLDKSCIFRVIVYLPKKTTWYELKKCYNDMFDSYKDKYGNPNDSFNSFLSPYYEGDGYELSAVANKKCFYAAIWELNYGSILLEISKFKQVKIGYEDTNNLNKVQEKRRQAINDDI